MAVTTPSDMIVYNEWVNSSYLEKIAQNVAGFNASSGNAINLTTSDLLGNYKEVAFFEQLAQSDLVQDRDKNSVTAITPAQMQQLEDIIPYLPSRFGPYDTTRSAFLDIGKSTEDFSMLLGEALADAVMSDMLNTSIGSLIGAIQGVTGEAMTVGAGSAGSTALSYDKLIDGMGLYGDRLGEIACFVMRGKDYYGLMKGNVTAATIDSIAGATLNTGSVATMGKPVLVTDSAELICKGLAADDSGAVLALTKNAITCIADTGAYITTDEILGNANIMIRWQGEAQYGLDLKGYAYDKAVVPTRTALKTTANWSQIASELKNTAGGLIITKL